MHGHSTTTPAVFQAGIFQKSFVSSLVKVLLIGGAATVFVAFADPAIDSIIDFTKKQINKLSWLSRR